MMLYLCQHDGYSKNFIQMKNLEILVYFKQFECVMELMIRNLFQVLSILMLSDFIPGRKPLELEAAFNQNLLGSFLLVS